MRRYIVKHAEVQDKMLYLILNTCKVYQIIGVASCTMLEIVKQIDTFKNAELLAALLSFLEVHLEKLEQDTVITELLQSAFILICKYTDFQSSHQYFQCLIALLENKIQSFQSNLANQIIVKQQFSNTVQVFKTIYSNFFVHNSNHIALLKQVTCSFHEKHFPFLLNLFRIYGETDLKNLVDLFVEVVKTQNQSLQAEIRELLQITVLYLQKNAKENMFCVEIIIQAFDSLKPGHAHFNLWIESDLRGLNNWFIDQTNLQKDTDLIQSYIKMLQKCSEYNALLIIQHLDFKTLINTLCNHYIKIREYEMNREMVIFFLSFLMNQKVQSQPDVIQLVEIILTLIFLVLPDTEYTFVHNISLIINVSMKICIAKSLTHPQIK